MSIPLLVLAVALSVFSSTPQPGEAALQPLAFLSGRWISETGVELQEETWSPISGDSMVGSFRIVDDRKPIFYEFWVIEVENERPVLKLKHFNSDFAGWEEKNVSLKMPLISASTNDAVFAASDSSVSLHYRLAGDALTCTVHHVKNGKTSDEEFKMTRAKN
jgi:hypothetical protein